MQHVAAEPALALAVAPLVEADRRQPQRDGGAREVVVAFLAGVSAVQDDDAGTRGRLGRGWEPQREGETVSGAGLRGEQRSDDARR
jgi:hypothetical protein